MKKITVYSFFYSSNIGDILIAEQVKKYFCQLNANFYDISSGKPSIECGLVRERKKSAVKSSAIKDKLLNSPYIGDIIFMLSSYKKSKSDILYSRSKESDIVIFAGGNIVMELKKKPTEIISIYKTVKRLKNESKKICFLFAGVGPFNCKKGRKFAKKIFGISDFIAVRDRYSFNTVKSLVPQKNIKLWCDPVLIRDVKVASDLKQKSIAVNVYYGYRTSRFNMKNAFILLIEKIRTFLPDYTVKLFSSELSDYESICEVKSAYTADTKVEVVRISSAEELYGLYTYTNAVIATRMHSLITAVTSGVPVISISWQNKVESVMELLENSEYNFSISEFCNNHQQVFDKLNYCLENREMIVEKNVKIIEELKKSTEKSLNNFIRKLEVM